MGGLKNSELETAICGHLDAEAEADVCVEECEDANEAESLCNIIAAVKILLQGLGEDVNRDGLKKTPLRVAKAFRDATRGASSSLHTFAHFF